MKNIRKYLGYSRGEVADLFGRTAISLHMLENPQAGQPDYNIGPLLKFYQVSREEFDNRYLPVWYLCRNNPRVRPLLVDGKPPTKTVLNEATSQPMLGRRMVALRAVYHLTREGLSEATGVPPSALKDLENNRTRVPRQYIERLTTMLGLRGTARDLLGRRNRPLRSIDPEPTLMLLEARALNLVEQYLRDQSVIGKDRDRFLRKLRRALRGKRPKGDS